MKYLVTRVVCVFGTNRRAYKRNIKTDDLNKTRSELRNKVNCDVIYFTYNSIE